MVKPLNGGFRVRCIQVEKIANGVVIEQNALAKPSNDVQDVAMADALSGLGDGRDIRHVLTISGMLDYDGVL